MEKIKGYLITAFCAILCSTLVAIIVHHNTPEYARDYSYEVYRDRIELHYQGAKDALVDVVDHYIDSVAPGSCLNGIRVVEVCDQYDFDIKFALAQGQLESHFGTTGIAAKTNMVWNVGAFDNKSIPSVSVKRKEYGKAKLTAFIAVLAVIIIAVFNAFYLFHVYAELFKENTPPPVTAEIVAAEEEISLFGVEYAEI